MPYVVGQVNTQPAEPGNPLVSSHDQKATVGADLKYALRPGVTLTATVNPDFGQVEADPAVVNLSGFETFFSERRPFFVEGAGMFAFDLDCNDGNCSGLFYPRRIGRAPRGFPALADGMYARVPQQTKILGAAKLTGRAGKFSFGAMNATTADEQAVVANGTLRTRESVEPLAELSPSSARAASSPTSRPSASWSPPRRAASVRSPISCRARRSPAALDWDLRMKKRYAVQGYLAGSAVRGSAEAIQRLQESTVHSFQRPDADHVEDDPTRTSHRAAAAARSRSEDRRLEGPLQLRTPGSRARASTSTTSASCAAPTCGR